jgi:dTDP-4-dehydrorhamnose 3,5-epimerase
LERLQTTLPDVWEIRPTIFRDARGFFMETYHRERFAEIGIHDTFIQDNHSSSVRATLRGLHYQLRHPQAKLCRVIEGEAFDVAVDIRVGSPTFGKWAAVLLSSQVQNQIYIPRGFAHGFLALTETVQFVYKCSDFYDAKDDYGIAWNDPAIGIVWQTSEPLVSDKDGRNPLLAAVSKNLLPRFDGK